MPAVIVLGFVLFWSGCAAAGAYIAAQKRRPTIEGVLFGFLFGPVGMIVESLLPTRPEPARRPRPTAKYARPYETANDEEDRTVMKWLAD
jgi:hypothetical protein